MSQPPAITWDEFMQTVRWEITPTGEIVTENLEHVPIIKRYLEVRGNKDLTKAFIQELGGEWVDPDL